MIPTPPRDAGAPSAPASCTLLPKGAPVTGVPGAPATEVMCVELVDAALAAALAAASGALALALLRGAVRHWNAERAGRAYGLPVRYQGAALRAAGAAAAGSGMVVVAVVGAVAGGSETGRTAPSAGARGPRVVVPIPPSSSAPSPASPSPSPSAPSSSASDSVAVAARTVGHPAGGTLQRIRLVGGRGRADVWLPPGYRRPTGKGLRFPVVVAFVPKGEPVADLFAAFAERSARGRAHAFIVVVERGCGRDTGRFVTAVDSHYRTLPGPRAHALLGLGGGATCALDTVLRNPGRYRSAASLTTSGGGGRDGVHARPASLGALSRRTDGAAPRLLLASAVGDVPARAAAVRLRAALAPLAKTRIVDTVARRGERRNLFAVAAGYLTEQLDGPSRS